jgi:hypothetical protein
MQLQAAAAAMQLQAAAAVCTQMPCGGAILACSHTHCKCDAAVTCLLQAVAARACVVLVLEGWLTHLAASQLVGVCYPVCCKGVLVAKGGGGWGMREAG